MIAQTNTLELQMHKRWLFELCLKHKVTPLSSQRSQSSKECFSDGAFSLPQYYKDSKDTLGVTKVDQMSEKDRCMIRKLALIELTSLYEVHNIKYTRRKPKRRYKGQWIRSVGVVSGCGQWVCSVGAVSGCGQWVRSVGVDSGCSQWVCAVF